MGRRHYTRGGHRRRAGWSRREFLAGTTAAGLSISLTPWLIGCGDGDGKPHGGTPTPTALPTPTPGPRPVEDCDLSFDFSEAPLEDLQIHVFGSEDDGARLQEHTAESRAFFRDENPGLMEVADSDLTHYLEDVTLPSDALQLYWITGCLPSGENVMAGMNIHVPEQVLLTLAETAAARGRGRIRTAKMRHYGIGLQQQDLTDLYPDVAAFVTPFDAALAVLFMQPDLFNINVTQGASILELLQTLPCASADACENPYINTLAYRIASAWPATESGMVTVGGRQVPAWAQLVTVPDEHGNPILDDQGQPAMTFKISDEIANTIAGVTRNLRKAILDAAEFEGFNWHPTRGLTTDEVHATQANSRSRVFVGGLQGGTAQVQVVGEHAQGTTVHGVEFTRIAVVDQKKRTVEVEVRNHFIRFVSAYVRFAGEGGDLEMTQGPDDTVRSKFLSLLNSNFTVMGVPLLGDSVEKQTFRFDIPENATKARIYFGSLGVGGEAFCPEAVSASIATLGFNIGIPVMMLAAGATGLSIAQRQITAFLQSAGGKEGLKLLVTRVIALAGPQVLTGIYGTKNSGNARPVLVSLGNAVLSAIPAGGALSSVLINLGLIAISSKIGYFFGPLGVAFTGLAVAADAATLAQTVAEVLASPAVFTNTVSLQMTTEVTIFKDPDNFTFPARARTYEARLIYDTASKVVHKKTGVIESGRTEPITVVFDAVPSGGNVSIEVLLRSDDGWIAGGSTDANGDLGPIGPIANNPTMAGKVEVTIKEQLIPLTAQTHYDHLRKLEYQSGAHVWVDSTAAPTTTRGELCQGQDDRLCNLLGITISQRTGNLGYAYQAGGQGVAACGDATGGVLYMVQNLSLASGNDRNLKQLSCGFREPAGIVYDRLGPADGRGRNFFVRPTASGYFLQSIVLDATTPIDLTSPLLSWGRFSQPMDALTLHPMGYVIGINRTNHKMEILQLPPMAVSIDQAPDAIPFAVQKAGEGERAGLLRVPVALTVSEGAVLVLEAGNRRVQAFDVSGNPVNLFAGKTAPTFDLVDPNHPDTIDVNATYLDIGVDGLGYVYALAYGGSGSAAADYRVDIYTPDGTFLVSTSGIAAGRFTVDTFRSIYTLNYETIQGAPRIEPSLSHWAPSTPMA